MLVCVDRDKRTTKSKLTIGYNKVNILSGNANQKEASYLDNFPLDEEIYPPKKMGDVTTSLQPSAQRSPSVASCYNTNNPDIIYF